MKRLRLGLTAGLGVAMACAVAGVVPAEVGEVQFSDGERIARLMDNSPNLVVAALERVLTQEEADQLEALLFPAPTDEERRMVLVSVKQDLLRVGFGDTDSVVQAVDAQLTALTSAETNP